VESEELIRRRTAHEAWSPDQFQVPPVEGKKRFHDFSLPPEIMHAVADQGFQYCTPIQAISLDHALAGRNVAGKAQTGTGKTAAFLLAILTRYLRNPEGRPTQAGTPRALVIAPTRELVIQICKDADGLGKYCGLRYLAVYGGMDHEKQRREVQAGPVDLLVATPGRLLDYVQNRVIDLSHVDTLVIDEADRMLDMGFIPDVRRIVGRLPPREKRCTMLYSATLSDDVMRLASQWMTEPVRVEIESEQMTVDTIEQVVYVVTAREKYTLLHNLLKRHADRRVLVFCNRRDSTERVAERLTRHGIACDMLSGDVNQNRRLRVLEDFRSGKVRVVVATDVAGRGLHVDDIGFVVNFDFPYEPEDYVHRIGRTGRAGHTGTAISFADEDESFIIPEIEKFIGEPLKCTMPDEALLAPISERGASHAPHASHAPAERQVHEHRAAPAAPVAAAPAEPSAGHAPEWPDTPAVRPVAHHPPAPVAQDPVVPAAPIEPDPVPPAPAPAPAPVVPEPAPRRVEAPRIEPRKPAHPPRPPVPAVILSKRTTPEEWVPGGRK
jgi:ATP-dependent RNA helicase RhlB